MSQFVTSFGLAVRQLRETHGWSQEQLAERADLNRSYVGELERAQAIASLVTLEKLAQALGQRPSALIADTENILRSRSPLGIKLTAIAC